MFFITSIKKILLLFFLLLPLVFLEPVNAQEEKVVLHLLWQEGCPHCELEIAFLPKLEEKYPFLEVKKYNIKENVTNAKLFESIIEELYLSPLERGTPITLIGTQYIAGYGSDEIQGKAIEEAILKARDEEQEDIVEKIKLEIEPDEKTAPQKINIENISVPFIGKVNIESLSLPVLTLIVAALDGFNPCAMWTLVFLIGLLLGMKDKKRMWILGTAFIAASAFVYFLFLTAWLNLILSLEFISWIRIAIGFVALGGGYYYLNQYLKKEDAVCKVTSNKKRKMFFERLKDVVQKNNFFIALVGIIILAFAVNLVEALCSAGLPAVYTQVLTLSDLPQWKYYIYLIFYVLIFMLDDLAIFFVSMKTLHLAGTTTKYSRLSHLIGGIVMLIIGLLLIFKPELLMFG